MTTMTSLLVPVVACWKMLAVTTVRAIIAAAIGPQYLLHVEKRSRRSERAQSIVGTLNAPWAAPLLVESSQT